MDVRNEIRIVCFDLGGVLVRICRTWEETCQAAGIEVRDGSATPAAERVRSELTTSYFRGELSGDDWCEQLSAALGGVYSRDELAAIHDAVMICEYDEVSDVVAQIHAAGVPTACLSNTTHAHWVRLLGLDTSGGGARKSEYPTVKSLGRHFASHLMGLAKPDLAIYRAFEEATGHRGESILFFDDLPENIEGARSAGWKAIQIDPHVATAPQLRGYLKAHRILD